MGQAEALEAIERLVLFCLRRKERIKIKMEKLFEAVVGIDAGNEVVELTTFAEETKIRKTISYDQFCDALLSSRSSAQSIKIGLFPREVLSVVWGEHDRKIYLFIPTAVRFLGYKNRSQPEEIQGFMVPYPNMILEITWKELDCRACPTSVWCTNSTEQWPTPDTLLYRFPFGNVSDKGSICMGGNAVSLSGTEKLAEVVAKCEDLFFNTPYNGDYYSVGNKINSLMSLGDLLTSLNGKLQFPDELLILDGKKVQDLHLN